MKITTFIYKSIETLKQVKFPTKSQVLQLMLAVIIISIILGIYLGILDIILAFIYKTLYNLIK